MIIKSTNRILIKNAKILINNSKSELIQANILIENGIITSLEGGKADEEIDLANGIVTVGWFDLNAHFNDPGLEYKEDLKTGQKVAAYGGFTDVNLMPQTNPIVENKSAVEYVKRNIDFVDLHPTAALTKSFEGKKLTEIYDLLEAGAVAFCDGDNPISDTEFLMKALEYTKSRNVVVFQNPRDENLSRNTHLHEGIFSTHLGLKAEPSLSEIVIIKRDLDILKYTQGRLHFTKISSKEAVDEIRKAKENNLNVTCDVSLHHLLFIDENIGDFDVNYKSLPPFRKNEDRKALIQGVLDGTIDAICSNHRPQDEESTKVVFDEAEFGSSSLQTFYPAMLKLENEIPFNKLIDKITNGARKVLGLDEMRIEKGMPAKLTLLKPDEEWVLNEKSNQSKSKNTPFWEQKLNGKVMGIVNGEKLILND